MNNVPGMQNTRYDFLDWLRVIAILLLLFFHTGMLFVGWGWHITNAETIPALQLPMDLAHRLRMPLLFVIAGAGMWFALQRRSGKAFAGERTLRLLVPAIVGMFLIVPPQVFIERLATGDWHGGYLDFYAQRVLQFQPYPAGDFSWHHLWFIIYLYVYVLLLLPLMLWWRKARSRYPDIPRLTPPGCWRSACLSASTRLCSGPSSPRLTTSSATGTSSITICCSRSMALCSPRCPAIWDWLAQFRRKALLIALAVTVVHTRPSRRRHRRARHGRRCAAGQCVHLELARGVPGVRAPAT